MAAFRIEHDLLGERQVPAEAMYGIHTLRAMENFPLTGRRVHPMLIRAYGTVKLAACRTNHQLGYLSHEIAAALDQACSEMSEGKLDEHIRVDALQGGAGTSTNMNVNEVLANRGLQILGRDLGDYDTLSPTEHVNLHQSTNDTYPTAMKVAGIWLLVELEQNVVALQEAFQEKEKQFADVVKVARTQFQDAVLTTLGREMAAYAEALTRDSWRLYKCQERLRVINLGGTAIGTGLGAPRQYIFQVSEILRQITSLGLARAENLVEATQNTDVFVEVSGICKALASSLVKICTDLRLLSSGPAAGLGEIRLPARQSGSSIMPGKVNPVIPEAVTQAAWAVMAHDQAITSAASAGSLELNAFGPLIADALLHSLSLLSNACLILRTHCVEGIEADADRCRAHVDGAAAVLTALHDEIGYEAATDVAAEAARTGQPVKQILLARNLVSSETFDRLTSPDRVNALGSRKKHKAEG
ncbi:MAG: aspartate ammonia-lyase [Planctomycetota bacterium]